MPDRFRVDRFDGNMFDAGLMPMSAGIGEPSTPSTSRRRRRPAAISRHDDPLAPAQPGQIIGRVVDPSGAPLPGVTVIVEADGQRQTVVTDANGSLRRRRTCRPGRSR